MLTLGSLFSGVGGLDMGVEAALGAETAWQVEIEKFPRRVLELRWPNARRFGDIRKVKGEDLGDVDVIVGGFPCQGFSQAGKRRGFCDPRTALWRQMARVVSEVLPGAVVVENVVEMVEAGGDVRVVRDLTKLGYKVAPPLLINASSFGAPHRRTRVFIVGYRPEAKASLTRRMGQPAPQDFRYPAFRGQPQHRWEPPRALPRAARYPGLDKGHRIHALGNAVMPEMGYLAGLRLREWITGFIPVNLGIQLDGLDLEPEPPKGARYWPTPLTRDAAGSRKDTARGAHWKSNRGTMLTDAIWLEDDKKDWGNPLNPAWVEALMGFPLDFTRLT